MSEPHREDETDSSYCIKMVKICAAFDGGVELVNAPSNPSRITPITAPCLPGLP